MAGPSSSRCWYLVDLCRTPVNHLTPRARRRAHDEGVIGLADTIRRLRPGAVVLVVRMISPSVRRALQLAAWVGPYCELPYPGRWATARHDFANGFRAVLRTWPRREPPARNVPEWQRVTSQVPSSDTKIDHDNR